MKNKIPMSTLGSSHTRDNLSRMFPFLLTYKGRVVLKTEIKSTKVLAELFGEDEEDINKLYALYKFQQCDTSTRTI